jgi:hypothetical protein
MRLRSKFLYVCVVAQPGARADLGRAGVRAGRQPSRRDSPNEAETGGRPGTGSPISGSRFDPLWGRWIPGPGLGAASLPGCLTERGDWASHAGVGWGVRGVGPRDGASGSGPVPGEKGWSRRRCQIASGAPNGPEHIRFFQPSPIPAWAMHRCSAILLPMLTGFKSRRTLDPARGAIRPESPQGRTGS